MARSFAKIFTENKLLPVAELRSSEQALKLKDTLQEAGINIIEVALRSKEALDAAEAITGDADFLVGLGSVLEADQLRYASQMGADFASSPGLNQDLLSVADDEKVAYLPGVFTASEVMLARDFEYDTVKFFPAYTNVGVLHYPQLAASFKQINFCLTGGVSEDNLQTTMAMPGVIACGGSWLAPRRLLEADDWEQISEICSRSRQALIENNTSAAT